MENIHPKILAIDIINSDLPALKTIVSKTFPNAELKIAQDANEGLRLCHFEKPDVVLLDISRSEMNGFEICSKIKSEDSIKHIPVLMITAARTEKESRIKALEAGADAFLTQPMDELDLFAQIKAMIRIKES
ncbi:MAG: response regulator, partial [Bacteroidales bacterium]|nr:response regulator [Bacteroidales bacterium]